MEFGKFKGAHQEGNVITVSYEKQEVIVTVITDKIFRILVPSWKKDYQSIAIEGDKTKECKFNLVQLEHGIRLTTGDVTLEMKDDFSYKFFNKKAELTLSSFNGDRTIVNNMDDYIKEMLAAEGHDVSDLEPHNYPVQALFKLTDDLCFYGTGDKAGFLNKRGYAYENWNSDIPQVHHENMPALYKSVPFVICKSSAAVCGLFFDNTFHSYMDFGKESEDYFYYGAADGNLDIYYMGGMTMVDIVEEYTYLTGRTPLPQLWTLGYHQCRWGYENAKDIHYIADQMRAHRIPCESVQYDIDYMEGYRVFTWNEEAYGPKRELIDELKDQGFKAVAIIDPGVKKDPGYFMYDEGIEHDYFAHDKDGTVYENAVWPGTSCYPDFGKSQVASWWADKQQLLTDMGVEGVWNDMNEPASFNGPLPMDVAFTVDDRLTNHAEAHNTYGHFMDKATYAGLKKATGKRPLVITRACYAGTQKYSAVWTGDNQSLWSHLQMLVPQLCNLGLSGFAIAGTDIGGFGGDTNPELMCRWIEAAAFSTFFRNHSAKGSRRQEPWEFDEWTQSIYRKYVELHYTFLPYIYDELHLGLQTGLPVMRPLVLHYEDDPATYNINDEYLVGKHMLVAPVLTPGTSKRMVYLPDGIWYDYWTGQKHEGRQYIIKDAPLDVLPIFIKEGSIIPTYDLVQYVGEKPYDTLTLLVAGDIATCKHYQDNGRDFAYQDGEYNIYHFEVFGGSLQNTMIHEGYPRYKDIQIRKIR